MKDNEILDLFHARSEAAIPALQEKYGPWCAAIAGRLLSDPRDAEECVSDCFLAVWNAIPPARPEHFKGWLGAVVRNRAITIGKSNGRRPPTVDESALELAACLPAEDCFGRLEAAELGRAISDFLRDEKPEARMAFLLRYWHVHRVDETAARLGWSVSKTKAVLLRTRNRLWNYLKKEGYL